MKIISWNVRGINASDKRQRIKQQLDSSKADIILLQETKLSQGNYEKSIMTWKGWCSVHMQGMGASGGLGILWNPKTVQVQLIQQQANWQLVKVQHFQLTFHLFNVYGPSATNDKRRLWETLTGVIQSIQVLNVIMGGDFNAILNADEKIGGICPPARTIQDFSSFLLDNDFLDVIPDSGGYTWTNKKMGFHQIAERLDRFLISQLWRIQNYSISSAILSFAGSDHFPIELLINLPSLAHHNHKPSFKFEEMWFRHPQFHHLLRVWWLNAPRVKGTKMYQFWSKLKHMKTQIKKWNKFVFKNVFSEKEVVKKKLYQINNHVIHHGLDSDTFLQQKHLQEEWEELCSREEAFWRQKSRELWLQEGDKNTKFFHATAKQNQASRAIFSIKDSDSGNLITTFEGIQQEGVKFFKNLLDPQEADVLSHQHQEELLNNIPTLVTAQDNCMLMAPFTMAELHTVVFSMSPDKSPGPDGFSVLFFQRCWDFICWELLAALEESRKSKSMLCNFNTTNIALIPKVKDPKTFADFRPISLCNVIYKIFTTAIYFRLKKLIPSLISPEQAGFVPGREALEGALVAHETLHSIKTHRIQSFIIKLDMMKAYDRLRWDFLFKVLDKFGFSAAWCKWVKACISGAWFSIIINGSPSGFFSCSQGIRQGDPLSPILFILMAEAFSRPIKSQQVQGLWKGAPIANTNESVTHSFFADDTLFGYASIQEARQIRRTLQAYTLASGQKVNQLKSKIYFFNTNSVLACKIQNILQFPVGKLPSTYLGIPFFVGANKAVYWNNIIERIKHKLAAWKVRWLSLSGRILLVKTVLTAIPNYFFAVLNAPASVISQIEKLIRSFLWSDNMSGDKKIPLVSLKEMSHPKSKGGVGLHELLNRNKAFGGKLIWFMYEKPDNKWCSIMRKKYLDIDDPLRIFTLANPPKGSAIWNFMMASREVVSNYITWEVHSGLSVSFWLDSWLGFPPLVNSPQALEIMHITNQHWGSKLIDFVDAIELHSGKGIWKDPASLPLDNNQCSFLLGVFKARNIYFSRDKDVVRWAPSKDGRYYVKEGYKALQNMAEIRPLHRAFIFCWNNVVLPKAGCFSWLALKKRILTSDKLSRLSIAQPFKCVLCEETWETADHILLHCPYAQQCWLHVLKKLNYVMPLPNSLWNLFQSWPLLYPKSLFHGIWKCAPSAIVWALWWERNKRIFRHVSSHVSKVQDQIEKSISESVNSSIASVSFNHYLSAWDSTIIQNWKAIRIPMGTHPNPKLSGKVDRSNVRWTPPLSGFVKINFDGASRGNPGKSGIGVCIRDECGRVLAIKSQALPPGTNNMAEAHALLAGLILARRNGFHSVHIEGDSMIIIKACLSKNSFNWKITYILKQIWGLLDSFREYQISHIYREGNSVADYLANMGCDDQHAEFVASASHPNLNSHPIIPSAFPALVELFNKDSN
jgi:ribonuclease HI/exonuclease III